MEQSFVVQQFIEQFWNKQQFDKAEALIHPDFKDYSLLPSLPDNLEGTKMWINATSQSFEHITIIEDRITEGNKCVVKIRMQLKHIGKWRDIEPTGTQLFTVGYRYFKLKDGKIIEHHALIDGQTIENQLTEAAHGCKIAE